MRTAGCGDTHLLQSVEVSCQRTEFFPLFFIPFSFLFPLSLSFHLSFVHLQVRLTRPPALPSALHPLKAPRRSSCPALLFSGWLTSASTRSLQTHTGSQTIIYRITWSKHVFSANSEWSFRCFLCVEGVNSGPGSLQPKGHDLLQ